ncbi:MAG: ABC transporter substrate-binding protein [Rhodospirillales bacterium]|jgi:peptide/nickel transport system substrate-binding protein|nr:ABC transporter substrate-binding protein [Rhodospirillales bacterium]
MLRKSLLTLAASSAAALLLAGVASAADLTIGLKSEPSSMDPHYHNLSPNNAMAVNIFDKLVGQDHQQVLYPGLALSWKSIGETTWEFKLRQGVKWHDGSPFTAADVAFTLERAPNVPNSPSSFSSYIKQISGVKVVDDFTIQMETKTPFPLMPTYMSTFTILSKKHGDGASTADYNSGKATIGTGPFKFVEFIPGDRTVIKRNPDYWGTKSEWDTVTFKPLTNSSARVAALLAGDVDMIEFVPTTDIANIDKNPEFDVMKATSNRIIYLHMDSDRDVSPFITDKDGNAIKKNPLKDKRIRRAISKAINRPGIVDRVMEGIAIPAGQVLPDGFFATSPNLKVEKYDPEGAKALMKEAGWGDGWGMTIQGPNNRYVNDAKICQAIASMLTKVGIPTKVDTMPKNVFFPRGTKLEFSFMLVGWGSGTGEPSSPLKALMATHDKSTGMGMTNRGRFSNKKYDELVKKALRTVDREKHKQLLIEATELSMDELGIIPLHFQINTWAVRKGIQYKARSDEYTLAAGVTSVK